jgi:hypothetical protein
MNPLSRWATLLPTIRDQILSLVPGQNHGVPPEWETWQFGGPNHRAPLREKAEAHTEASQR